MPRKIQIPELLVQLPQPTGDEIKDLCTRKHWTYREFAEITGVSGQRQVLKYINGDQPLSNARWAMAKLAAGEHPTLALVPLDPEQAAALGLPAVATPPQAPTA